MRHRSRRWIYPIAGLALIVAAAVAAGPWPRMSEAQAALDRQTELETLRVERGDTLSGILAAAGVRIIDADRAGKAIQREMNLRRMSIDRQVRLLFGTGDAERRILLAVSVETGRGRFVEATRTANGGYRARRTALPLARAAAVSGVAFGREGRVLTVARNETIGGILHRHGIAANTVDAAVKALRVHFDPRALMPGQSISIVASRGAEGAPVLSGFAVHLDGDSAVTVVRTEDGGFVARRTTRDALRAAPSVRAITTPVEKPACRAMGSPPPDTARPMAGLQSDAEPRTAGAPEPPAYRGTLQNGGSPMAPPLDADVRGAEADTVVRRLRPGVTVRIRKRPGRDAEPHLDEPDVEVPRSRRARVERARKGRFSSRIAPGPRPADRPRTMAGVVVAGAVKDSGIVPIAKPTAPRAEPALAPVPRPTAPVGVAGASVEAPATTGMTPPPPEPLPPFVKHIEARAGDTLMAILRRHGIDRWEADRAIRATRKLFNPRRLRIGQKMTLVTGIDPTGADSLEAIAIHLDEDRFVKVTRASGESFGAARVTTLDLGIDRPGLTAATGVSTEDAPHAGRADRTGHGQVMNGALVAGAAPIAPAGEPRDGTAAASVSAAATIPVGVTRDGDDGLVRKAVVIDEGDTLSVALTRAGSARGDAEAAIVAFRKVHNPRRLQIGQTLSLSFEPERESNGALRLAEIALDVAPDREVVITRGDDGAFLSRAVDRPLDRVLRRRVGVIETSLYDAALVAGIPIQTMMEMLHIFSYDVDFQRDIQPGNGFEILHEAAYDPAGNAVEHGPLLYAALEAGERAFELFRHEPHDGPVDYLDSQGESARKALMRTPINGARLSSGYGMRRHPILGYSRKHLGVDFAAPRGTPVFAAGDGTIEQVGREGNYGKYIRIRHNGAYSTAYAHLSGYAKGMKRGKRVRQGQVIGYVGSTGMSTGPHLHYEVLLNRKRINPMALKLPTGRKLKGRELAAFRERMQKIRVLLAEVPAITRIARQ